MTVELDVFSGQPNPRWELTPEQSREFRRRAAALPHPPSPPRMFDGLGYRGLVLHDPAAPSESFRIGFGWVVHQQGAAESNFVDQGRGLEKWLLSTARGKIDERLLASIGLEPHVE